MVDKNRKEIVLKYDIELERGIFYLKKNNAKFINIYFKRI